MVSRLTYDHVLAIQHADGQFLVSLKLDVSQATAPSLRINLKREPLGHRNDKHVAAKLTSFFRDTQLTECTEL